VLAEIRHLSCPGVVLDETTVDGLVLKGNESGGFVGESSSFVMLQKWRNATALPLYLRGGLTPQVAAACQGVDIAGGVLDSQVLLLEESPFAPTLASLVAICPGPRRLRWRWRKRQLLQSADPARPQCRPGVLRCR